MSIAQPQQCQVIDIRNKDTKVHVNSFECIILTKEKCNSSVEDTAMYCGFITIGDHVLHVNDIILADDINLKLTLPFKIAKISKFDFSKSVSKITLHSFVENASIRFLAPTIGNIAFNIMQSPLFVGAFAYYPELESTEFKHSVHFLLRYNKQIKSDSHFEKLNELISKQNLEDEFRFDVPYGNENYLVFTKKAKPYWINMYQTIMRSQYSLLNNAYMSYLKSYLNKEDYLFIEGIVQKSDILITAWEEHLSMKLPKNAELYQAMDIEKSDGLYEHNLINKEEYERVKRLARYLV